MNTFWTGFAKIAVKVGVWAAGHPDAVIAIVNDFKSGNKQGAVSDIVSTTVQASKDISKE